MMVCSRLQTWWGMCISSHLFHSSTAEQPKPILPRDVNRSFHCNDNCALKTVSGDDCRILFS